MIRKPDDSWTEAEAEAEGHHQEDMGFEPPTSINGEKQNPKQERSEVQYLEVLRCGAQSTWCFDQVGPAQDHETPNGWDLGRWAMKTDGVSTGSSETSWRRRPWGTQPQPSSSSRTLKWTWTSGAALHPWERAAKEDTRIWPSYAHGCCGLGRQIATLSPRRPHGDYCRRLQGHSC